MTRLSIAISASLLMTCLVAPCLMATDARAADDQNAADVRCVVVAFGLIQSPDPQVKALAEGASLYFVGRIRGRAPDLDMEAAIIQQVKAMTPDDMRAELQRCSGVLQEEGGRLQAIGARLQKMSADAAQPPK